MTETSRAKKPPSWSTFIASDMFSEGAKGMATGPASSPY